eukprot:gene9500-32483_t
MVLLSLSGNQGLIHNHGRGVGVSNIQIQLSVSPGSDYVASTAISLSVELGSDDSHVLHAISSGSERPEGMLGHEEEPAVDIPLSSADPLLPRPRPRRTSTDQSSREGSAETWLTGKAKYIRDVWDSDPTLTGSSSLAAVGPVKPARVAQDIPEGNLPTVNEAYDLVYDAFDLDGDDDGFMIEPLYTPTGGIDYEFIDYEYGNWEYGNQYAYEFDAYDYDYGYYLSAIDDLHDSDGSPFVFEGYSDETRDTESLGAEDDEMEARKLYSTYASKLTESSNLAAVDSSKLASISLAQDTPEVNLPLDSSRLAQDTPEVNLPLGADADKDDVYGRSYDGYVLAYDELNIYGEFLGTEEEQSIYSPAPANAGYEFPDLDSCAEYCARIEYSPEYCATFCAKYDDGYTKTQDTPEVDLPSKADIYENDANDYYADGYFYGFPDSYGYDDSYSYDDSYGHEVEQSLNTPTEALEEYLSDYVSERGFYEEDNTEGGGELDGSGAYDYEHSAAAQFEEDFEDFDIYLNEYISEGEFYAEDNTEGGDKLGGSDRDGYDYDTIP